MTGVIWLVGGVSSIWVLCVRSPVDIGPSIGGCLCRSGSILLVHCRLFSSMWRALVCLLSNLSCGYFLRSSAIVSMVVPVLSR